MVKLYLKQIARPMVLFWSFLTRFKPFKGCLLLQLYTFAFHNSQARGNLKSDKIFTSKSWILRSRLKRLVPE